MTFDIQAIATALGGASPSGDGYSCLCPAHDDKTPSLSIGLGDQNKLLLYCHGGCSFEEVLKKLQERDLLLEMQQDKNTYQVPVNDNKATDLSYIRQLWRQAIPVEGTLAHLYLRGRLDNRLQKIPPTLRYLPDAKYASTGETHPCLLAAVTIFPNREVIALHRTFLSQDGLRKAPVNSAKMMLGPVRGGAVRLAPAGKDLIIAEGIETGLTVQVMMKKPTWAALSSKNMESIVLPPLPLAQNVYIAQDNDPAGQSAAVALADKAWAEGRRAYILYPPAIYNDFNDVLFLRRFQ